MSWECPYKICRPCKKWCDSLDLLCEHILDIKDSFYVFGHTRFDQNNKRIYIQELICDYCNKCIIPENWRKDSKVMRCEDIENFDQNELIPIIKRRIVAHTRSCDSFKNWFDMAQIKEGLSKIQETQSSIIKLLDVALYGPEKGVLYEKTLQHFEEEIAKDVK